MRRRYFVRLNGREVPADVEASSDGTFRVSLGDDGTTRELRLLHAGQPTALLADGSVLELYGSADGAVTLHPGRRELVVTERARSAASMPQAAADEATIRAPMHGRVLKLFVSEGDSVTAGAGVAVVEAMKMENEILAPRSGRVTRVLVSPGDTVERDAPLVELE